jgi:hypothetical protein
MSNEQSNTPQNPNAQHPNSGKVHVQDNKTGVSVQLGDLSPHKSGTVLSTLNRNGLPVLTDEVRDDDRVTVHGIEMRVAAALRAGLLVRDPQGRVIENGPSHIPEYMKDSNESGGTFADSAIGYVQEQLGSGTDEETARDTLNTMLEFAKTAPADVQERLNRTLKTPQWRDAISEIAREYFGDQRNTQMTVELSAEGKSFMADAFNALQAGGRNPTGALFALLDGQLDGDTTEKLAASLGYKSTEDFTAAFEEQGQEYNALLDEKLAKPAGVKFDEIVEWAEAGNISSQEYKSAILLMVQQNRLDGFAKILAKYQKANPSGASKPLPQGVKVTTLPDGREVVDLPNMPRMTLATAKRMGLV